MRYIKIIIGVVLLCTYSNVYAQLSTHEQPISFDSRLKLTEISKGSINHVITPPLDMAKIEAEDEQEEGKDIPPRFGFPHKVDYNLNNSGTWYELPNGDRLWQLNVSCPDAKSINFLYDKFWLPDGGKFFLYTKDRKQSIGAFTSRNNKGSRNKVRGFATELLFGNDVVLEYYQPKEVVDEAIISICTIVHGYRSMREGGYGQSGSCQVNVNCSEGQKWQNEKKAVALIVINGTRSATGSLINTTDMEFKPFFLTANHCLLADTTGIMPDPEYHPNLDYYLFYWNYEAPSCDYVGPEPTINNGNTTHGAVLHANCDESDFALIRLSEDPIALPNYIPYYLGWDNSGNTGTPGVCIHHPNGDVKKISTVAYQPTTTSYYGVGIYINAYWLVIWAATLHGHGITAEGSSGSPLLNGEHRVIGQLRSGTSYCDDPTSPDIFGKFDISWTNYNASSIHERLDHWLDSIGSGMQALNGLLVIPTTKTMNTNDSLYSNIRIISNGQLTIQSNVELIGNGKVIVDAGGKLIVNGGKLSNVDLILKPGATLDIINGGIIETQNDFIAPLGAVVNISNGQIRH